MKSFTLPKIEDNQDNNKPYWTFNKKPAGPYKFRILGLPLEGYIQWETRNVEVTDESGKKTMKEKRFPIRSLPHEKPISIDPNHPARKFWTFPIWNYQTSRLELWEITQKTMMRRLTDLNTSEDFGPLVNYDIRVKKIIMELAGGKQKVEYTIDALFPKPLAQEIIQCIEKTPVRMSALYEAKDPFKDLISENGEAPTIYIPEPITNIETAKVSPVINEVNISGDFVDKLSEKISEDGISVEKLDIFLSNLASKENKTLEQVAQYFLDDDVYSLLRDSYAASLVA